MRPSVGGTRRRRQLSGGRLGGLRSLEAKRREPIPRGTEERAAAGNPRRAHGMRRAVHARESGLWQPPQLGRAALGGSTASLKRRLRVTRPALEGVPFRIAHETRAKPITKSDWHFTTKNARIKLKHLSPSI